VLRVWGAASELVHVRVQAAPWVDADRRRTIPLDGSSPGRAPPAVRYESDVTIPVAAGRRSYVVFVADGWTRSIRTAAEAATRSA